MKISIDLGNRFEGIWDAVQDIVHITAKEHGFYETFVPGPDDQAKRLALIHSELSEALESIRKGDQKDDKIPDYSGATAELADAVIRITDFGEAYGLDIGGAIVAKANYNDGRPYRHGGKAI